MRRAAAATIALLITGLILAGALAAPAQLDCASTPCTYLPIVLKPGPASAPTPNRTPTPTRTTTPTRTSTPTRTATVTPSATATQVPVTLFANGDFEQGSVLWYDPARFITDTLPIAAHSGTHALWLRGMDGGEVDRDITVPLDTPYLSYWIWIRSTEPTCGDDRGGMGFSAVHPPLVDSFDLCVATETNGWVNRVVDLSAVAGQTGTLVLIAGEFDGDMTGSDLFFDDIGWRAVP